MRGESLLLKDSRNTQPHLVRKVLDNGLEMILLEDHSAPVVAFQFWVRFGSADENPRYAGVAHVFEHMLFKGTDKYPHGEIGALIEGAGGVVNAWTSYDETVYHVTLSSRYWETALDVLIEAILHSRFDPEELRKEIEVVQEEIRRGKDNPDREISERLLALSYDRHPYRRPVIGFPETVSQITRDAMLEIYHTWYVPNNMVFVAVGDFHAGEVISFVEQRFSQVAPRELPERPRTRDPRWQEERYLSFSYPADLYRLEVAFYGVEATDPRAPALDLLADILSNGYNSLLYQKLKVEENLALEVFSYNYTPVDPGIFSAGASFAYNQAEKLIPKLVATLASLRHHPIPPETLAIAKTRVISQFLHNRETYQGIARALGEFTLVHRDPHYDEAYIAAIERVTPEDLQLLAEEILDPRALRVALLSPEKQPAISEEQLRSWIHTGWSKGEKGVASSPFPSPRAQAGREEPQAQATASPPLPPHRVEHDPEHHVTVWHFSEGPTVVVQRDAKAPLVTMRVTLAGGQRYEPPGKEGIASLLARVLGRGTRYRTAQELEDDLDRIGGVFSAAADRDALTLALRVPREHLRQAFALFQEILLYPSFPSEEVERERQDQLQAIAALPEQKFTFAFLKFLELFYKDHPYNHLPIGTETGVKSITLEDLRQFYTLHLHPPTMVFAFVGDTEEKEILDLLRGHTFSQILSLSKKPAPEPLLPRWQGFKEQIIAQPGNQTHILWGFPTVTLKDQDRYPLSVLDAILSGMGGRLFVELRDKRSLAYAVSSFDAYPLHPGFMVLYIGCAPEKEQAALAGFEEVLNEIRTNGISEEELARAKRYLTGVLDVSLQSTWNRSGSFAGGVLFLGKWNAYEEYVQGIEKVTPKDVQEVVQKYLNPEPSVRVILRGKRL